MGPGKDATNNVWLGFFRWGRGGGGGDPTGDANGLFFSNNVFVRNVHHRSLRVIFS